MEKTLKEPQGLNGMKETALACLTALVSAEADKPQAQLPGGNTASRHPWLRDVGHFFFDSQASCCLTDFFFSFPALRCLIQVARE
ncbi:hypothetical protein GDO78_012306 [Eleutherodactylus coqui]|uniref:Uncharacterized protein n=1 Tax=Eleutherodactylus coqui TaxID=57060 RepID=A0A8J6K4N6_ELECQ|nr:hypothetical protein GDO78_012306 [Eleutherodactylus coqui]